MAMKSKIASKKQFLAIWSECGDLTQVEYAYGPYDTREACQKRVEKGLAEGNYDGCGGIFYIVEVVATGIREGVTWE